MHLLSRRLPRPLRFAAVGAVCFVAQSLLLLSLIEAGAPAPVANTLGFAASAQLNFALSTILTWGDRPAGGPARLTARWASYQGTSLLSLTANTVVFTLLHTAVGPVPAAALGVLSGAGTTFVICHFFVFRMPRAVMGSPEPEGARP